ncbi:MAG: hypothetical protein U0269_22675 [Polyangiales bacterium]
MSWFLEDAEAREACERAGFTWQAPHTAKVLAPYLPFAGCRSLDDVTSAAYVLIGPYTAWLVDFDYTEMVTSATTVSGPTASYSGVGVHTEYHTAEQRTVGTLAIVQHPALSATVDISADWKASTGGAIANALLWIPPFTFVKAFQYMAEAKNPDHVVGQKEFDKRFVVHSPSEEMAREAISPALGELLVSEDFKGSFALRPGAALVRFVNGERGAQGFERRFGFVRALVGALDHVR